MRDASAFELSNNVHEVQRFENGDKSLDGDDLADPVDGRFYKDFSDRPLFADAGPSSLDMRQGAQADCWLISAMGSIAKADPNRIRQTVVDLGDGTYGVQLAGKFYRVDGDLPTDGPTTSNLVNAGFGQQNSIWLPIIEKAYTFKTVLTFAPPGTAAVYAMGGADTSLVYGDLGMSVDSLAATSASTTLFYLASQLRVGRAVTLYINTPAANCPCIGNHFYVVERVNFQGGRPVSVVLRNPWGRDGAGSDGLNDGLVTVSGNQLVASGAVVRSATV